jgi:hypothetical protein
VPDIRAKVGNIAILREPLENRGRERVVPIGKRDRESREYIKYIYIYYIYPIYLRSPSPPAVSAPG